MPKKKPIPKHPPSVADMRTKDLLRSIRTDLEEKAKQSGLAFPQVPPKPHKSR